MLFFLCIRMSWTKTSLSLAPWSTLCAYLGMLAPLLTHPFPFCSPSQHNVIRNALFCLDTAWKSRKEGAHDNHVYTKALLAYAFALAGDHAMRKEILKSLDGESVKEGKNIPEIFLLPTSWAPKNILQESPTCICDLCPLCYLLPII